MSPQLSVRSWSHRVDLWFLKIHGVLFRLEFSGPSGYDSKAPQIRSFHTSPHPKLGPKSSLMKAYLDLALGCGGYRRGIFEFLLCTCLISTLSLPYIHSKLLQRSPKPPFKGDRMKTLEGPGSCRSSTACGCRAQVVLGLWAPSMS